jgi:hypothetical protein
MPGVQGCHARCAMRDGRQMQWGTHSLGGRCHWVIPELCGKMAKIFFILFYDFMNRIKIARIKIANKLWQNMAELW